MSGRRGKDRERQWFEWKKKEGEYKMISFFYVIWHSSAASVVGGCGWILQKDGCGGGEEGNQKEDIRFGGM